MRILFVIAVASALGGCASIDPNNPDHWTSIQPNRAKTEREMASCKLEAATVAGYDWIDAALRRNEVFELCMKERGYYPKPTG